MVVVDHRHRAQHDDAVVVLENLVLLDPHLPRLDDEDALTATALYLVVHDKRVHTRLG